MLPILGAQMDMLAKTVRAAYRRITADRCAGLAWCARAGIVLVMSASSIAPLGAQGRQTMGVSRADLFIAAFGPSSNNKALRTSALEMQEQVRLAFYAIDSTRAQMAAGMLSEDVGNRAIDGFETTIRNYVQDHSNDALIKASLGQAADIPAIARVLSGVVSVARQDSLMGREALAQQAQAQLTRVLTTFSQKFSDTCQQQSFPVEVALGLQRQNDMMGTGISLSHCAYRKYSADISSQGVQYHFEACTAFGEGEWDLTIAGNVSFKIGKATARLMTNGWVPASGVWEVQVTSRLGYTDDLGGSVDLVSEEVEETPAPAAAPNDAGPLARPNHWPKASPSSGRSPLPQKITIQKLRMETIDIIPGRGGPGYNGTGRWAEAEIRRGLDQACTPKK